MPINSPAESIFEDARRLIDPAERRAYLDRTCGDNCDLRDRIDLLLSAYEEGGFLESPPAVLATAPFTRVGEQPGDSIGPYKLLEQIGEGGMGLVFVAEQTRPLRRRVALKIIKPGLDTRAVIARFEAERQALALMDHPNIARVFDAGATGSGRPYFVMELVRGAPITDCCRDRQVALRERLELFIQVCHAVQHAHQKGVIHRDLKPTNILVTQSDTAPVPKVIDFGVAKATTQSLTEQTAYTAFSRVIGTPLYMSPEQADLGNQDIDTRSDVYSLGVVLYELLTGVTPFDAGRLQIVGHDEMCRIIREEEPPKPSTRATTLAAATTAMAPSQSALRPAPAVAVKGDLDWIVMKALEKDRRRRYDSAIALANDLRRHLVDEPVEACPPSFAYKVKKFSRRHRAWLAFGLALTILIAALILAVGVIRRGVIQRRQAIDQATAAAQTAIQAGNLELADRKAAEAAALLPNGSRAGDKRQVVVAELRQEIDGRRQDQQRFEQFFRLAADGQVRIQAEMFYGREKTALEALDLYDIRTNPQWLERLNASHLDKGQIAQVCEEAYFLLISLAMSTLDWNKASEGIELLKLAKSFHDPTRAYYSVQASCLKKLGDDEAANAANQSSMNMPSKSAWDWVYWGRSAEANDDGPEAIKAYEAALCMQPNHFGALLGLALRLAQDSTRRAEAIQLFTGCIALEPRRTVAYLHRSAAYRAQGNVAAADADLALAVERSANPQDEVEARRARVDLLLAGDASGHEDELRIIDVCKQELPSLSRQLGEDHEETLKVRHLLANKMADVNPSEECVAMLRNLIDRATRSLGGSHELTEAAHRDLARLYVALGRYPEAVQEWEITLRLGERRFGAANSATILHADGLARTMQLMGNLSESMVLFQDAMNRLKQGEPRPGLEALLANNAAHVYREAKRYLEAIALFEQSLAINYHRVGPSADETIFTASALLYCYSIVDGPKGMLPTVEEVVGERAAKLGVNHVNVLQDKHNLGCTYRRLGRVREAVKVLEDAIPRFQSTLGPKNIDTSNCLFALADIYVSDGRHDAGISLLKDHYRDVKSNNGDLQLPELLATRRLAIALAAAKKWKAARELLDIYWTRAKTSVQSNPEETRSILIELAGFYNLDKQHASLSEAERDITEVEAVLELEQAVFEPDDRWTQFTKKWLGVQRYRLGQKDEGIRLMSEVVDSFQRTLGPGHIDTADAVVNLADFYFEARRYSDAKQLMADQWSVWKSILPQDQEARVIVAKTTGRLGDCCERTGELEQATECWRRLNDYAKSSNYPDAKLAREKLFANLVKRATQSLEREKPIEAELLLREALALFESVAPDDWHRFHAMSLLGGALTRDEKFEEAEPLLIDGYKGLEQRKGELPTRHNGVDHALERLVAFYESTDRDDEATAWREKLAAQQAKPR